MEKSMNKNRDYCKFVEDIKKEVQDIIKDWGAEAVFVPAGSPETEDCLIVKIPTDEGMGMQRFFMEEIYQDLRDKRGTMEESVEEVRDSLKMARQVSEMGVLDKVDRYDEIRDSLILRPFNYDANAEKLDKGIFYQIGDVALVLYINIGSMKDKYVSSMVSSNVLSIWEKTKKEVIETAIRNTYRLFPPRTVDVYSLCFGLSEEQEFMHTVPETVKNNQGDGIFVTTVNYVNGAIAVFMPGVMERLSELLESDIYFGFLNTEAAVIHKSNLVPPEVIRDALRFQNHNCGSEEFLSEKVYFYSRERDRIEVVG